LQLKGTEQNSHYDLLELFTYGTFAEYHVGAAASKFGALPPPLLQKLRVLSLVSLATQQRTLPYGLLYGPLSLEPGDAKALEEVIVMAIYAGLLDGTMDQRAGVLQVRSTCGRDVPPDAQSIGALLDRLSAWRAAVRMATVEATSEIAARRADGVRSAAHAAAHERKVVDARKGLEAGKELTDGHSRPLRDHLNVPGAPAAGMPGSGHEGSVWGARGGPPSGERDHAGGAVHGA